MKVGTYAWKMGATNQFPQVLVSARSRSLDVPLVVVSAFAKLAPAVKAATSDESSLPLMPAWMVQVLATANDLDWLCEHLPG